VKTVVSTERKKLYTLIELGCTQLGLDDETKRVMFRTVTRQSSKKDMDLFQLNAVLTHLCNSGFVIVSQRSYSPPTPAEKVFYSPGTQAGKIAQLWAELHAEGRVRDASTKALRSWVSSASAAFNRGAGISDPAMLPTFVAQKLIERLKKWQGRP
jgi:phage gp16-like protein